MEDNEATDADATETFEEDGSCSLFNIAWFNVAWMGAPRMVLSREACIAD